MHFSARLAVLSLQPSHSRAKTQSTRARSLVGRGMELQEMMVPERVEQLIISLYQPNPPEVIASTQAALARIQSLPQAWTLSKELLSRRDEKVQFFGVLTIIIKLNTQSASISDEEAIELLICLIGWYVNLIRQAESRLVTRKLVSALSTFFLRYHTIWPRFLDHIGVCLANNQVCYPDTVEPSLQMCHMIEMLGQRQMQALLWVATHVVEDVLRLDPNSAKK
ncbi:Importin beta-like protein [Beauveria bassiana]|nr:Importin beta-like protein [Beauveria bassiana]